MEYLSEDATYLAGALVIVAAAFFLAMRVSQQGKYLLFGLGALGLAVLIVVIEWLWVTDNERIEGVVYNLGRAVEASDTTAAFGYMTDDVECSVSGISMPTPATKALVKDYVSNAHFDFLRISQLKANARPQARRGTAEFKVLASGSFQGPGVFGQGAGTSNSQWSLGFRETSPGVWKVNRITPLQFPGGLAITPPREDAPETGPRRQPVPAKSMNPPPGRKTGAVRKSLQPPD